MLQTGSLAPVRQGRPAGGGKLVPYRDLLIGWVEQEKDITMPELAARLVEKTQVVAYPASLSRFLKACGFTFKKNHCWRPRLHALTLPRRAVSGEAGRLPRMRPEPYRLVFVDETGTTTKMTRLRGRARRGERLRASAPFGHWATQTFIAGLRCDGLTAPWIVDKPMNRQLFETWIETQLAPTLHPGDVVILDNLSSHKSPQGRRHPQRARRMVPLPPALFARNPIEMAFAKLKAHLRRIGARTIEKFWQAVGHICDHYSPDECWNYLAAAGYAPD
ncbi:IS630 family transposase [Novosphingobium soli]|uniref:IS630 family transposase n=1 Tax=Novosphingobium soli TaxID=574956 RepID=A0ABV6CWB2_9SPHN